MSREEFELDEIPSISDAFKERHGRSRRAGRAGVPGADRAKKGVEFELGSHWKTKLFDAVIDTVVRELKVRFVHSFDDVLYALIEGLDALHPERFAILKGDNKEAIAVTVETIVKFAQMYRDVIAIDKLRSELKTWIMRLKDDKIVFKNGGLTRVVSFMHGSKLEYLLPELYQVYIRAVVLPVLSCEIERSFSAMKFIKNALRSKMGQDRLEALLLMYSHPEILDSLDLDDVLMHWYVEKRDGSQHRCIII